MRLFGTDGIRGIAGQYPLDDDTVRRIGRAAAEVLQKRSRGRIVIIGRDTRESGEHIGSLLGQEFSAAGIEVWNVGVIPTPGIAHLVKRYPVLAGVVISASHNPYQDNGIKFFGHSGTKLPDAVETHIEERIKNLRDESSAGARKSRLAGRGKSRSRRAMVREYNAFLTGALPEAYRLNGLRLAIDCANGATCRVAPRLFASLGADVVAINTSPDGRNINLNAGSLHPQTLSRNVIRSKAQCGIAFDGDGDRVIFVDEKGEVRDGDYLLSITSAFLKERNKLRNNTLVTTVMANLGLFRAMERHGINVLQTPVGDRYVYEKMVESDAVVGGEQSGHIIFRNFLSTGDGILSALQVLAILRASGKPLSELCGIMQKYPQVLLNTPVRRKLPIESLIRTTKAIKDAEKKLRGDGRVLVRYSGTENLIRVMIEGQDKAAISDMARDISDIARAEIEKHPPAEA